MPSEPTPRETAEEFKAAQDAADAGPWERQGDTGIRFEGLGIAHFFSSSDVNPTDPVTPIANAKFTCIARNSLIADMLIAALDENERLTGGDKSFSDDLIEGLKEQSNAGN